MGRKKDWQETWGVGEEKQKWKSRFSTLQIFAQQFHYF